MGNFFRSLSITFSIPKFFFSKSAIAETRFRFFRFFSKLAIAETRFRFCSFLSARWQLLNPIPTPIPIFFSARWQLLNPTPFSFSKPQVAVAETDTDSETENDFFSNWQLLKLIPKFSGKVTVAETDFVFFWSPNSATVAVVVTETEFSLEILRHSTAISPKRKLVGLMFE